MKKATLSALLAALLLASCGTVFRRAGAPFTVNIYAPRYAAGSAEAQFDKVLGGIKKDTLKVYYCPEDDAVCLEYRAESVYYSQFWSREGREAFSAALERYKQDYDGRSLVDKSRQTKRAYGKARGYLAWSAMRVLSDPAKGACDLEMGYTFKERSPFFAVTQRPAEYINTQDNSLNRKSNSVPIYYTRAQAEALALLFDQEYLLGIDTSGTAGPEGLGDVLRGIFNVR